jgi:hypothetical protein
MRRLAWLLVPLIAVLVWWLVRSGSPATHTTGSPTAVAERTTTGEATGPGARPATPSTPTTPASMTSAAAASSPGSVPRPAAPIAPAAAGPVAGPAASALPPGRPSTLPSQPAGSDGAASGGLKDKTGWGDDSVKQLNKELTPLISECIDQAKARNPKLHGSLVLGMSVAPTDSGKVIISATPTDRNEVVDAELLECIRESSFAMESLKAPHDFQISLPID